MDEQNPGSAEPDSGRLRDNDRRLLRESVHRSIRSAKEQALRSSQLVSRSHEILGRTRQALAQSNLIRDGMQEARVNPAIAPLTPGSKT